MFALVALPAALFLVGCSSGKKSFTLKGAVSYQGKPLNSGVVRLHMAESRMAMAMIQPDGSFEATDVFPGEATATVEEIKKIQRVGPFGRKAGQKSSAPPVPIPAKYKEVDTSGLVFTLAPGRPLEIKLE
jgi:hypothetical protein